MGFGVNPSGRRRIFDYLDIRGEPVEIAAKRINPYLVDAPNIVIRTRHDPLCDVPQMSFGNMPADGGKLLMTETEAAELLEAEPGAEPFVLPLISAKEFLHNKKRYCLWLKGIEPKVLRSLPITYSRVEEVRTIRQKSARPHLANTPALFAQVTQEPHLPFVLVPRHSSENRSYIPIGIFEAGNVAHDSCMVIKGATLYHFGALTSRMHMAWVRAVCGRLESRYRYSKDIVYNNFPWPIEPSDSQKHEIEQHAQAVFSARNLYPNNSLADLYDPLSMPIELTNAHQALDRAIDQLYRRKPFDSDEERLELLFKRYQALTS
ncbi:hypothetical protein BH23CHL5_BH23CHL5_19780 [soil metagenome]